MRGGALACGSPPNTRTYKATRVDLFNGDGRETSDDAASTGNFQYDANGNTVDKSVGGSVAATYDYDFEDRLVETSSGGSTTTY